MGGEYADDEVDYALRQIDGDGSGAVEFVEVRER